MPATPTYNFRISFGSPNVCICTALQIKWLIGWSESVTGVSIKLDKSIAICSNLSWENVCFYGKINLSVIKMKENWIEKEI